LPLPGQVAVDHVVPCRVLVDRMIMNPDECAHILGRAIVLARITKAEQRALGRIYTDFERLYARMLRAPVSKLPSLGRERYRACGIELTRVR
jgi:hypothetical protein